VGAIVFTPFLMTLALDPRTDAIGVAGLAFCGPMMVLIASVIIQKLWFRRMHATAVQVQVTGCVPIGPSRATPLVIYGTMTVAAVIWVTFWSFSRAHLLVRLGPYGSGILLSAWTCCRVAPGRLFQLNPEGITFGRRRFACTVPWDAIAGMSARDVEPRPALRMSTRLEPLACPFCAAQIPRC